MRYDVKRFLIGNDAKISKFQKADAIVAGAMGPNNRYFHAPNVQMLGRVGTLRTCPIPPSVYLLPPWEFNPPSNIVEVCCVCFLYFVFSQTKTCQLRQELLQLWCPIRHNRYSNFLRFRAFLPIYLVCLFLELNAD